MKKFLHIFGKENSLRSASIILVITLALSNVLGLLRDRFLAHNISFSDLDIYFAAFRIPDTLFNFLILGAITSAFIPVFSEYVTKNKEEAAKRMASSLITLAASIMLVVTIIFYFLMPYVTKFVVPDFTPDRLSQTVKLSRILMLTPVFFSVSYIIGGILNSYKRFFAYSLSPLMYNLSIIIGAIWIAPRYGVTGVAYAVVVGAFLHVVVQLPALSRVGFHYKLVADVGDKAIRRIGILMIPRSISLGMGQALFTVYTAISSSLVPGAIAAFNFSNNIQTVPTVVLGNSFATAVFPTLASAIARGDNKSFARYLTKTIRAIGYLLIPSSVLLILLRAQIVRLILGSGKVGWGDTKLTALTLGFFAISLIAQGLVPLLARAFFALKDTRLPMIASIIFVVFSILIAYPLSHLYSVAGLALAFSLGNFLYAGCLFLALRRRFPEIVSWELCWSYLRIVVISLLMAFLVRYVMHYMAEVVDMSRFIGVFIQTLVASVSGIVFYLLLSYLVGCDEMRWAFKRKISVPEIDDVFGEV